MAAVLVLAFALILVPPAYGKGSAPSRVCGEDACVPLAQRPENVVVLDGNASRPQPPTGPYYRLDFDAPGIPSRYFVPTGTLVSGDSGTQWCSLYGPVVPAIR